MSIIDAPALVTRVYAYCVPVDAVLGNPGVSSIWAKVPKTVTKLGHAPGITSTQPVPANTTPAPTWFTPTAPDLGYLFNVLLPKGVEPQYKKTVNTPARIVAPTPEISDIRARVRTYLRISYSDFDITPKVTDVAVTLRTYALAPYTLVPEAGSFTIGSVETIMQLDRGIQCEAGAFICQGYGVNFIVPSRTMGCATGAFGLVDPDLYLLHMDQPNSVNDALDPLTALVVDGGRGVTTGFKNLNFNGGPTYYSASYYTQEPYFGANSLYLETNDTPFIEYDIGQPIGYGDFTIDMWHKANSTSTATQAIAMLGSDTEYTIPGDDTYQLGVWVTGLYLQSNALRYLALDNDGALRQKISHQLTFPTPAWRHIAVERYNGIVRIYVNGVCSDTSYDDSLRYLPYSKMMLFARGGTTGRSQANLRAKVDEVYATSTARYQGNSFTVPNSPYSIGTKFYVLAPPTVMPADAGSYTVTGQNAIVHPISLLSAAVGSFALTGQAANLQLGNAPLQAAPGSFSVIGKTAGLAAQRVVSGATATYTLVGKAAAFVAAKVLSVGSGAFTASGQNAAFTVSRVLQAVNGVYTVQGKDAGLNVTRVVAAAVGTYNHTGQAVNFSRGYSINSLPATYTLTGNASILVQARVSSGDAGAFNLTGQNATLLFGASGSQSQWVLDNYDVGYEITGAPRIFD